MSSENIRIDSKEDYDKSHTIYNYACGFAIERRDFNKSEWVSDKAPTWNFMKSEYRVKSDQP